MTGSATENRRFINCPTVNALNFEEQVVVCPGCSQFGAMCCQHPNDDCHHHRLFFADGACLNNGRGGARGGVGVAAAENDKNLHVSKPFSDLALERDGNPKRTNQIAELRAAIEAVALIERFYDSYGPNGEPNSKPDIRKRKHQNISRSSPQEPPLCVIGMDLQYVVKGMTEWLPIWKENGLKTKSGYEPANLNLFLLLEQDICRVERKWGGGMVICFWWIPRGCNKIADKLAKDAAKLDIN
ncbi:hypothetical protein TWF970_000336 [Orbilia oligospora]|uniref:ribonuclease H n=1 Tax=Orbilia oligospora TaxID=2813651 RepID=A0A7C8VSC3_ORBOL|nr:hypothetical protein TWF970_000336 [Orbilia oligospora]